jgi:hypothetical protein
MLQERARTCRVELSDDGVSWLLVHAGNVHFLGGTAGPPLTLPLGCRMSGRFVRVSLAETNHLHLAQVEIFANIGAEIREQTGLPELDFRGDFSTACASHANQINQGYWLESQTPVSSGVRVIGLKLTFIGRLGNQIIQLIHAICLARRLGLKYIVVLNRGMIRLPARFTHDGIDFIADATDAAGPGAFLTGNFFFRSQLAPVLDQASHEERYRVVHDIIMPRLMEPLPDPGDVKYDDELTVHVRSGDIFTDPAAASGYTQPPLAFYTLLVRHLIGQGRISRVRLVFEDRANPCIGQVIAFLQEAGIPHRTQSGTLVEDLVALIDAPLLVFGFGTFGVAVGLLSRRIDTVFCFEGFNDSDYAELPSIGRVVVVRDHAAGYTKVGDWSNSPEQRRLMLEYPESALEILAPRVVQNDG